MTKPLRRNPGAAAFALDALLLFGLPLLLTLAKFVTELDEALQTLVRDAAYAENNLYLTSIFDV